MKIGIHKVNLEEVSGGWSFDIPSIPIRGWIEGTRERVVELIELLLEAYQERR